MKKTIISFLMICFMTISVMLSGCSSKGLKDNPATDANVISNGGMTVVKDDYLYYVNGYVDSATLTKDDNEFGDIDNGAIYRTKLVNGEVVKNKDGLLEKTELVVPKLVGFGNGGFYIMGDYIYYATPYMKLDKAGALQTDRVEFHKINIDGTDDEVIYVTGAKQDNLDWTLYDINNKVYLATFVEQKLIIVNTSNNEVVAEISDCTSYALLHNDNYKINTPANNELEKFIYFTREVKEDDGLGLGYIGNLVCKVNIETGDITKVDTDSAKSHIVTIKYVNNDKIYYNKKICFGSKESTGADLLYVKNLTHNNWRNAEEVKVSNIAYASYYFCDFGDNLVIASNPEGTYFVESGVSKQVLSKQTNILKVFNNQAYYAEENKLFRFDIRSQKDGLQEPTQVTNDKLKHTITNDNFLDFDNQRIYVYCEYTAADKSAHNYLSFVDTNLKEKFVGKFADGHLPERPKSEENKDEILPYVD